MMLSRRSIEKEVQRIVQDTSPEALPRIRQRLNDVIAEISAETYWEHLRATTTFQTLAAITKGLASMTKGSASIVYVSGSTSPSSKNRKIIIGADNFSYIVTKVSSGTHLIAERPRETASVSSQGVKIVQDIYQIPTVVDEIESVFNITSPVEDEGILDYIPTREFDEKHPSTAEVGSPEAYTRVPDTVTTEGTGTASGSVGRGTITIGSGSVTSLSLLEGMAIQTGCYIRTIKSIASAGSRIETYEPAPETFTSIVWKAEKRLKNIRLHPIPDTIETFMVRHYRREFGLHRMGDFWKADGKFHRLLIDGTASRVLAELRKPDEAKIYGERYAAGVQMMRNENLRSPDETQQQLRPNILGGKYRDTWK